MIEPFDSAFACFSSGVKLASVRAQPAAGADWAG
jgi:hypothetical protein